MASRAIHGGGATALPLNLIAQAIPMLTRHELASVTERLIDYLDHQDGDNDIEANGDELDGSMGEDDFNGQRGSGPGCPLADPDVSVDDLACDEPYQDLEPEEPLAPLYGIDQWLMVLGADHEPLI